MLNVLGKKFNCEVDFTVNMIRGKWKVDIIWCLNEKKLLRFGELKKMIPNITQKILAQQLSDLEYFQIVTRKVYPEIPPRVEYELTDSGKNLFALFEPMIQWADSHFSSLKNSEPVKYTAECYDTSFLEP
ncbi:MAG TPA: helix-turn-helix domain-containing protein [Clostridia bacterium]|nr:helix-turn-helix domain-containing protein [Clostridia bacterium]